MGHLRVNAAGSAGAAEDGNAEPLNFTASVTDHDGDAVEHLDQNDFDLRAFIIGPGGPPVDMGVPAEAMPGVYVIQGLPQRHWTRGTYLYVLTVEHHHDRGQTVIPVTVPR